MKSYESVKTRESDLPPEQVVQDFLTQIPTLEIWEISKEAPRADLTIQLNDGTNDWIVLVEVKNTGHPSRLTNTIEQLSEVSRAPNKYGLLVVPWMSEKLEAQCRAKGVGCVDLEGNGMVHHPLGGGAPARSGDGGECA